MPDGSISDFYVFGGIAPVIILPVTKDRKVVAIRQFRYGANCKILEIPGGQIKEGSTAEEALKEELLEETGYVPGRIYPLENPIYLEPSSFTVPFFPYLALDCYWEREPSPEKTEVIETVLVPLADWMNMIYDGRVRDSKTIATTFRAYRILSGIGA